MMARDENKGFFVSNRVLVTIITILLGGGGVGGYFGLDTIMDNISTNKARSQGGFRYEISKIMNCDP